MRAVRYLAAIALALAVAACGRVTRSAPQATDGCVRTGCGVAHKNCGLISDGCGGTIDCGGCTGIDNCGGGGEANVCGHGGCPDGKTRCGDRCADLQSDSASCGACDAACQLAHASAGCQLGQCLIFQCGTGYADCDGMEANGCETALITDEKNCGVCGLACAPMQTCTNGICSGAVCAQCPVGFADCDCVAANGCEVDLLDDPTHCGGCGIACLAVAHGAPGCAAGICGAICDPRRADCNGALGDGCEVDLDGDPAHCGTCETLCLDGAVCLNGLCVADPPDAGAPADLAVAIDLAVDNDLAAPADLAPAVDLLAPPDLAPACMPGFGDCDGDPQNGCEASLLTDPAHCGGCGTVCAAVANGFAGCLAGSCGIGGCNVGFADCDRNRGDGCEVGLLDDPTHCGGCGIACPAVAHGTAACVAGACAIGACNAGFADCDGDPQNGCEVDLFADAQHCGSCGVACGALPNATSVCSVGACRLGNCNAGFENCDGNLQDGCEANLLGDVNHCGNCNTVCPAVAHGLSACVAGACALGACDPGFGDCDGNPANGCEDSLLADPTHCGGCGIACPAVANGTPGCSGGACGVASCAPGFGDCDGSPGDGCEASLESDPTHCGGCAQPCPAVANGAAICAMGTCGLGACNPGFGDCDGSAGNGCEANLQTDPTHCGGCGIACPAEPHGSATCAAGVCGLGSCAAGFGNCDGNAANGCETNLTADAANCGGCGIACPAVANGTPGCSNGACGLGACNGGFGNCDGNASNGCETTLKSDRNNCGSCGHRCTGNRNCVNGICF